MIYLLEESPRDMVDSPFNFVSKLNNVLQNAQTISLKLWDVFYLGNTKMAQDNHETSKTSKAHQKPLGMVNSYTASTQILASSKCSLIPLLYPGKL